METNAPATAEAVNATTADVWTVQGSQTPHDCLMMARVEASRVASRLGHSIKIYLNGELHSLKRY